MSLFGHLQQDANVEQQTDDVFGGKLPPMPSNIYQAVIERAYISPSKQGAMGVVFDFMVESQSFDKPRKLQQTFYVTNREGKNTYSTKDGKLNYLPGFNIVNNITNVLLQKSLRGLSMEDTPSKAIPIYNFTERKEVMEQVNVIPALWGKRLCLCIQHKIENKTQFINGKYLKTDGKREYNEVDRVLFLVNNQPLSALEIEQGITTPAAAMKWSEVWKDKVKDTYTDKDVIKESGSSNSSSASTTKEIVIG